jgi:hypothetical protein
MKYVYLFIVSFMVFGCSQNHRGIENNYGIGDIPKPSFLGVEEAIDQSAALERDTLSLTVKGISWGVYELPGGDVVLHLGDSVQQKDETAKFVCMFPAHQKDFISIAKKDAQVKIKGKIRKTRYNTALYDCTLQSVEFPN